MRDCPDGNLRDLLPVYAAGRLTDADRARVETHVAACADCMAELGVIRSVARAYAVGPMDTRAIVARIPARRPVVASVPFYRQRMWRLAASVTVMIGTAAMVTVVRSKRGATPLADWNSPIATASTGAPGSSTAAGTGGSGVDRSGAPNRAMAIGVSLSDLSDDQLESLLSTLDTIDANVMADPEIMATPIVPSGTDPDQGGAK